MKHFLLLCNRPAKGTNAGTVIEYIDALNQMPGWKVWELSMLGHIPKSIALDRFDAIGIHYMLHLSDPDYHFLSQESIERLHRFNGLKCVWMQDEYRRVHPVATVLQKIGVDIIFSLASNPTLAALYPKELLPHTRLETVLAGYVSQKLLMQTIPPLHQRSIDISYRTRRPPYWLGSLGQEKINIGEQLLNHPLTKNLKLDISVEEQDRIYGDKWLSFLANSKAVLCVESGSSVIDFSGELEQTIEKVCQQNKNISFAEVRERYLADIDGKYLINPISPRVFEAAAMRTVMIAFIGKYSDLMQPWVHYIPLEKDFSNLAEVIATLNNPERMTQIADNARRDLAEAPKHSYAAFSAFCSNVLLQELSARPNLSLTSNPYTLRTFKQSLLLNPRYLAHNYISSYLQQLLLKSVFRRYMFRIWFKLPYWLRETIKPVLKVIGR